MKFLGRKFTTGIALAVIAASLAYCPAAYAAAKEKPSEKVVVADNGAKFGRELPGKIDGKLANKADFVIAPVADTPLFPAKVADDSVSIMGSAEASVEQMVSYIKKRNPSPKLNCSVETLVKAYYIEAGREGIRPDIALCQAIKETGVFGYGGDVSPSQNNFCGLGATGNKEPGAKFATPQLGARAHIQHLMVYATKTRPSVEIVDPRYDLVIKNRPDIHGHKKKWTDLNGVWAVPGTTYGQDILKIWRSAKAPDGSDASLAAANKAATESPDDVDARVYRAAVYMARNEFFLAKKDLDAAIKLKPMAEFYHDRAIITGNKNPKEALKDYDEAIRLNPKLTEAYYNRGLCHMALGKYKEATKDFNKTLELEPQYANAKNNIGVMLAKKKKYADAWAAFYDAHEINSANKNVLANQKILTDCLNTNLR